ACDRIRAARSGPDGSGTARVKPAGRPRSGRTSTAAPPGPPALDNRLMAALRSGNPAEVGPLLANDLQQAAISLRPDLRRTLAAGTELGALAAVVSGSGPTCAYLARDARHAAALAVPLAGAGVCRTVVHVVGPAPGASVTGIAPDPR